MTADTNGNVVRYGRINTGMLARWMQLAPEEDAPFWALNLMKYREVADYADGRTEIRSGREADDQYTPRESLAAIGAEIAFAGDVERTLAGDGTAWDRVGIVRYPSRRKFFEMQQRDDFKRQHKHKDAGMEFTIVMACLPILPFGGSIERRPLVELRVSSNPAAQAADAAAFNVEGVIVGDERTWATASFRWLAGEQLPAVGEATKDAGEYHLIVKPMIDRLIDTVLDSAGGRITS